LRVDGPAGRTYEHRGALTPEALSRACSILLGAAVEDVESLPALYSSGVRYRREPAGSERWLRPSTVRSVGAGDCEDLAAWRTAELIVTGQDPASRMSLVRTGPAMLHAIVRRGDGRIEDPSALLGMVPSMSKVGIQIQERDGACKVGLRVPMIGYGTVESWGEGTTAQEALSEALGSYAEWLEDEGWLDSDMGQLFAIDALEIGFIPGIEAAATALLPYVEKAFSELGDKFLGTDYDALRDLIKNVGKAEAGIELTGNAGKRAAEIPKLWASGVGILYCSDSEGTRREILELLKAQGFVGLKAWWQAYDKGGFQKSHWYGIIVTIDGVPQALRDAAAAGFAADPQGWVSRSLGWALDVKGKRELALADPARYAALSVPLAAAGRAASEPAPGQDTGRPLADAGRRAAAQPEKSARSRVSLSPDVSRSLLALEEAAALARQQEWDALRALERAISREGRRSGFARVAAALLRG